MLLLIRACGFTLEHDCCILVQNPSGLDTLQLMMCLTKTSCLAHAHPCRSEGDEDGAGPAAAAAGPDGSQQRVKVVMDGWLSIRVPGAVLAPLHLLRQRITACFASKVLPVQALGVKAWLISWF
jgi:hypothetical protein